MSTSVALPVARPRIPSAMSASSRLSRSSTTEQMLYGQPLSQEPHREDDFELEAHESEVEAMVDANDRDEEAVEDELVETPAAKRQRVWPEVSTSRAQRYQREVQEVREHFEEEVDMYDTTMVSEYADEIFQYMEELEVSWFADSPECSHSPRYPG
jgi:molecular chaperone GrpE (heat shock protein)